ncbi:SurA N-terminal domain-containing protein, partial [Candidatus Desantisbacteria bacterium]|nr:SurA N-terminal domain-containing protein [Candidatus Desantisbacteria bacterium]
MIKKNFYFNLILFLTIIFTITLKTEAIIVDRILAKVNNEIITQSELEEQLDDLRDELLQNYKPEEVEKVLSKQRLELLGKLIETKILMQEAKKLNITLSDEEVDKEVNKNREQVKGHFESEEKFLDALQQKGLNPDSLKEKIQK